MKQDTIGQKDEYRSRINRVIDYIETHLDRELHLDELAGVACFSKYHFHRIFLGLMNETLFEFIQRVRVEKAAALLLTSRSASITQISYECGFSGPSAFARAFKNRFSMTATQWRETTPGIYSREKAGLDQTRTNTMGDLDRQVTVRVLDEMHLAYVRYTGKYEGDAALFKSLYQQLFTWAMPRDLVQVDTKCIVAYHDSIDITESSRLRVSAGITVPGQTRVSSPVGKMILECGKYACARFELSDSQYYRAWQWVFSDWLPKSGYQPGDGPCFEYYPDVHNKDGNDKKTTVDICVPVIPL